MKHVWTGRAARGVGVVAAAAALLAAAGGTAAAVPTAPKPCTWTVRTLPAYPINAMLGWTSILGTDGGQTFAGRSIDRAVLWRDGKMIDLGLGEAADVNRAGVAVGYQVDADYNTHAVLWRGGATIRLAEPSSTRDSRATGINDTGLIIGYATSTEGSRHVLAWSASSPARVRDLGSVGRDLSVLQWLAGGVTEAGAFAGTADDGNTGPESAFTGTVQGGMRVLSKATRDTYAAAYGIGGRYVVGTQQVPSEDYAVQPVVWTDGQLSTLPGGGWTPAAVNSSGMIAGNAETAVVWQGGQLTRLPALDLNGQTRAEVITEDGTVGGSALTSDSVMVPVTWSCR
jgi:uncharacterized membrane protein